MCTLCQHSIVHRQSNSIWKWNCFEAGFLFFVLVSECCSCACFIGFLLAGIVGKLQSLHRSVESIVCKAMANVICIQLHEKLWPIRANKRGKAAKCCLQLDMSRCVPFFGSHFYRTNYIVKWKNFFQPWLCSLRAITFLVSAHKWTNEMKKRRMRRASKLKQKKSIR